jgi:L-asparaginase
MKIRIITTGGTIDKIYFDTQSKFEVGDSQISRVLEHAHVSTDHSIEALFKKDSLELTDADRMHLRNVIEGDPCDRVLITHGTDTMAETAMMLTGIEGKTVVLTGALSPARFHESDAIFNIGFAFACAQVLTPGVYLAMHGMVFDPAKVRKNRDLNRFEVRAGDW